MVQIGIAGAGILGRVLAWQLHREGYQVTLFDGDTRSGHLAAAWTAAGMLTPHTELETNAWVFEWSARSLQRWGKLIDSLAGKAELYRGGCVVVAHPADRASQVHFEQLLKQHPAYSSSGVQTWNQTQLRHYQPELAARFQQALWLPQECWVNPAQVMNALADQLLTASVSWYEQTPVLALTPHTIHTQQAKHTFDVVIDTRGLGAKQDWAGLRGVRGEVIELYAPEVKLHSLVRLLHPRYALYIVPRPQQRYVIGATQIESEDTSAISVRSALELLSAAYSVHHGFAEARVIATRTQCRPTLPDHCPALQVEHGLIRANGLYRHGILLAPEMAQQVIQQLKVALC